MIERIASSRGLLAACFVLAALVGAGALLLVQRVTPVGGSDRAQIERVVHDYLVSHPEVLPEAMQALQDRQSAQAVAANRPLIETPFGSAWAGNPKGDVTVAEYYDYDCGYCRASLPIIDRLIASDPKVKVVFRDFPVLTAESETAARWSLAAAMAGKFKPFHDALYAAGPVSDATLAAAAKTAGLDPTAIAKAAGTAVVEQQVRTNLALGRALGMTGTPSWVIGDRVLSGALPLEQLQAAVAAARKG